MQVKTMEDTLVATHCNHMPQHGVSPIKNPLSFAAKFIA